MAWSEIIDFEYNCLDYKPSILYIQDPSPISRQWGQIWEEIIKIVSNSP